MEEIKCEACGGKMVKEGEDKMKCESCGAVKEMKKEAEVTENKEEAK